LKGKTLLARAVAGEAQAAFISVGPSDILSKFVGESEASVRNLFKEGSRVMILVLTYNKIKIKTDNLYFTPISYISSAQSITN